MQRSEYEAFLASLDDGGVALVRAHLEANQYSGRNRDVVAKKWLEQNLRRHELRIQAVRELLENDDGVIA